MSAQLSLDQFASAADHAHERDLDALAPVQHADYRAVVLDGTRPTDRARERDVRVATVSRNVNRATDIQEGRE